MSIDRRDTLRCWQKWVHDHGGMIDKRLIGEPCPDTAIIHDNLGALDRYLSYELSDPAPDWAIDQPRHLAPIPYGDARFVGRRVEFRHHGGATRPVLYLSTGMGAPSSAIVAHELAAHGVKRIIKVGTSSGLDDRVADGDIVVPLWAIEDEGTSKWNSLQYSLSVSTRAYFGKLRVWSAGPRLRGALVVELGNTGGVVVTPFPPAGRSGAAILAFADDDAAIWPADAYPAFIICPDLYDQLRYQTTRHQIPDGRGQRTAVYILGVEMECAALFSAAEMTGIKAAALIVTSRTREEMKAPIEGREYTRDVGRIRTAERFCLQAATRVALA
jgi:uridine phosphorylase